MANDQKREYQRKWRAKVNADPELLNKKREYQRNYQRRWISKPKNREKSRTASLASYYKNREANCEASHWRNVKRRYGITKEQYERILSVQGGTCALCTNVPAKGQKRLSIDHCHRSTIVRGLLCEACNVLLGRVEVKSGWLDRAKGYLSNPPAAAIISAKCAVVQPSGLKNGSNWR